MGKQTRRGPSTAGAAGGGWHVGISPLLLTVVNKCTGDKLRGLCSSYLLWFLPRTSPNCIVGKTPVVWEELRAANECWYGRSASVIFFSWRWDWRWVSDKHEKEGICLKRIKYHTNYLSKSFFSYTLKKSLWKCKWKETAAIWEAARVHWKVAFESIRWLAHEGYPARTFVCKGKAFLPLSFLCP